jgi:Tfp pilus assembly protein PilX
MKQLRLPRTQTGATLIVGLILLVVITLVVVSAFTLSTSNLKAVGNMQFRDEAVAASNSAIEGVLSSLLINGSIVQPPSQIISVDIDHDNVIDYTVNVSAPTCIRATQVASGSAASGSGSSVTLGVTTATPSYNTIWDINANVTDARSGASVQVRQGVRVVLTQAQKNAVCL